MPASIRIGVDTGGTFTDFVVIRDGRIEVLKEFSTPSEPEQAILNGLARLQPNTPAEIIHGSTVATNALLERKGAHTAFVTNAGFEHLLHLRRQNRASLYRLCQAHAEPLVQVRGGVELDHVRFRYEEPPGDVALVSPEATPTACDTSV